MPRPSVIIRGNKRVKIGTPVYVHSGFDVIIDCDISNGTPPINITWFRNGSPYPTEGNVSTITITDARNNDVFECRVDNIIGFDTENTTIYVEFGKYTYTYKCNSCNTGISALPCTGHIWGYTVSGGEFGYIKEYTVWLQIFVVKKFRKKV